MSSSIFFKFRSQKEPLQMTFDGTSLSVFEVKRDIIALSKLGDGLDFDLDIYAADTNEKYDDDTTQIPRNSTVIAKRSPAVRPGAGRAARYVTGKMPVNAKNAHRMEFGAKATPPSQTSTANGIIGAGKEMTEDEKMQAMFQAQNASWQAQQQSMSHKPIVRSFNNKQTPVPDKPLPPGYTCHRCGEKGHWIQACPTNNDPNFDNRPKFKRTTGIPRSFLKVVEKPTLETGEDGKIDVSKLPQGVMYTANGEWVVAEPDKAAWDKFQEKQKASTEKAKQAAAGDQELRDRGLECPIDKRVFVNPQKTPCCGKTYCFECIENALVEGDLTCPNCGEQVIIDNLEEDQEMAKKVADYEDEKKAARKKRDEEAGKSPASTGSPKAQTPNGEEVKPPAAATNGDESVQVNGKASASPPPNAKKRPAEDELENDRKPSNPATEEVNKTGSKQGTPASDTPRPTTASSNTPKPTAQPPAAPAKDIMEFQKQMNAMAGMPPSGPNNNMNNMNNMNGMMNPMFNPAMMGMPPMPMNMPGMNMNMGMNGPMGMGMGMPMMPPNMWNMPNNNNGNNNMGGPMNGFGGNNGNGYGHFDNGNNGYGFGNGNGNAGGNDGPYMRQPVNPYRHRNRQNRPRSQDFRQV